MSPWLQWALGACALLVTFLKLAGEFGWWAGRQEGDRVSDGLAMAQLALEVTSLRAWRHKVGDDPLAVTLQIIEALEKGYDQRLERLERKVFNGSAR